MRLSPSSLLQLAYQLALLLASANAAVLDSGISEIDLMIPTLNSTYDVGANGRFPLVWAMSNPNLWRGGENAQMMYEIFDLDDTVKKGVPINTHTWSIRGFDEDTRYMSFEAHLKPEARYQINWYVYGQQCDSEVGFRNDTESYTNGRPASYGWHFKFYTKPGGQKVDISSAAANCSSRTGVAYNIAHPVTNLGCRAFDQDDPYPSPSPCDMKIPDDKTMANITRWLDEQFKTQCSHDNFPSYCPRPPTPTPTGKSGACTSRIGAGALLLGLGLPVAAFFL